MADPASPADRVTDSTPKADEGADAAILRFVAVERRYGDVRAVDGVTSDIAAGSFTALVGASGSGKSTLLKTVNTLVTPTGGQVLFAGEDVTTMHQARLRRRVGYVFQGIGLFPHFTVAENIAIGPRLAGEPLGAQRIAELLQLVELDPAMAGRMPDALSGGQRQRVGVARALAGDPELLIMDEPFGALDPITRDALGDKVRELHETLGLTTIMVTHDMAEALLLADRVLVMSRGQIVADETPRALLTGAGGDIAQELVAVPRQQAERLADMEGRLA
ncbi:ATP-binding cassette domain-containing protein [Qipengyuania nanhaisediminis]|uniref:ATP-binding cassette domain-containing protein n=1 Tax=Qipengyuania nanhaisediminis TaxID=604088 RepID=UPI0038B3C484